MPARIPAWIVQMPSSSACRHEPLQQRPADPAPARGARDVDRVLRDAAVAGRSEYGAERRPAERSRRCRARRGAARQVVASHWSQVGTISSNVPMSRPVFVDPRARRASPARASRRSSQRDRTSHVEPLEEAPVVGDDDQAALVGLQCGLELLDRLEVEVVRRLVEDQAVDAARREQRERRRGCARPARARRRPGRCRRRRARTSRAASARRSACSPESAVKSSRSTPWKRSRAWVSSPKTTAGADAPRPRGEWQVADERADQRRLPRAVRADDGEAVAPVQLEVDRAEA